MRVYFVSSLPMQKMVYLNSKKTNTNFQCQKSRLQADTVNFKGTLGKVAGGVGGALVGEAAVMLLGPAGWVGVGLCYLGALVAGAAGVKIGDKIEGDK